MATDSDVQLEQLIDLIDKEDKVNQKSKSRLKSRLEQFKSGPNPALQKLGRKAKGRLEQQASYDWVNKEVSKWSEVVQNNQTARTVDFTQKQPPTANIQQLANSVYKSQLQSQTEALLNNQDNIQQEQNHQERAKARSDLINLQLALKRKAKIKSKLYHKRQKRKREKNSEAPELDQETKQRQDEYVRAQERITQRHSRGSRFKRTLTRFAKYEHDVRNQAMANNEQLLNRIKSVSKISSQGEVTFDSSSDEDEEYLLKELERSMDNVPQTGVLGMKFMRQAIQEKKQRAKIEAKQILNEIGEVEDEDDEMVTVKFKFNGKETTKKRKVVREIIKEDDTKQQELVDRAFEMDQVAQEEWKKEEQEKQIETGRKEGWGSWTGSGISKPPPPPQVKKYPTSKVILNQDRDKKVAKFTVKQVPFPFNSARQYEVAHNIPIGKDWNSHTVHQDLITPEVISTPGEIIQPISIKEKQRKT